MRSLIESFIDVGSGFILAIIIQLTIFPLFGLHPTILGYNRHCANIYRSIHYKVMAVETGVQEIQ